VDHGYRHKHYTIRNEAEYDYPFLAINITNQGSFNFSFPINVYDAIDPIDIEFLKNDLFVTILEKTLSGHQGLKEL
jgi:hypothetical protein